MNVALVASRYAPHSGALERHVDGLARGLALRGVQVEVLTQDHHPGLSGVSELDGVVVRRFAAPIESRRFAVSPGLWNHLHRAAASFDLVHAHCAHLMLGLAVAHSRPRHFLFTPHTPIRRLLRRPYGPAARRVVQGADVTVCMSRAEANELCRALPWAHRVRVVPSAVDAMAIKAARPFPSASTVVLVASRLEPFARVDRAIAAMASLDPAFRLVVVGDGPARRALQAHAADLQLSSRVLFVGQVPDTELYRWLRSARVLVSLTEQSFGIQVLEAVCAGASVVASDIPAHREAAACLDDIDIRFVPSRGSPLQVADAISKAAGTSVWSTEQPRIPTWDAVIDSTLDIYDEVIGRLEDQKIATLIAAAAHRPASAGPWLRRLRL